MLDVKFIERKLELIKRDLGRLGKYQDKKFNQIVQDWLSYSVVKNLLMEVIGRGIDINLHLIRELLKPEEEMPTNYEDSFFVLVKLRVLPDKFAREIAKSAGFRNAVVHGYNNLDKYIVYKSIKEAISQYIQYCGYILKFLEKKKRFPERI